MTYEITPKDNNYHTTTEKFDYFDSNETELTFATGMGAIEDKKPLAMKLDGEGRLWLVGSFKLTAAPSGSYLVTTLPAKYVPKFEDQIVGAANFKGGSGPYAVDFLLVSSNGEITFLNAPTESDEVYILAAQQIILSKY